MELQPAHLQRPREEVSVFLWGVAEAYPDLVKMAARHQVDRALLRDLWNWDARPEVRARQLRERWLERPGSFAGLLNARVKHVAEPQTYPAFDPREDDEIARFIELLSGPLGAVLAGEGTGQDELGSPTPSEAVDDDGANEHRAGIGLRYRHWYDVYPGAAETTAFTPIKSLRFTIGGIWPKLVGMTREQWFDYYGPIRPAPGMHSSSAGSGTGNWYVLCGPPNGRPVEGTTPLPHQLTTDEFNALVMQGVIDTSGTVLA